MAVCPHTNHLSATVPVCLHEPRPSLLADIPQRSCLIPLQYPRAIQVHLREPHVVLLDHLPLLHPLLVILYGHVCKVVVLPSLSVLSNLLHHPGKTDQDVQSNLSIVHIYKHFSAEPPPPLLPKAPV